MMVQCATCPKRGHIGNAIRYTKVTENGKIISVPLCTQCAVMIDTKDKQK